MEIWKEIKGYEGLYEVSSEGRVRVSDKLVKTKGNVLYLRKGVILKESYTRGYSQVVLTKDGIRKGYKVHRLVAESFIPNPDNKPEVDHINCDRSDNIVENLRWVTAKENSNNPITLSKHYGRQTRLGSHPTPETLKKMSESHKGKHWTMINNKRVYY